MASPLDKLSKFSDLRGAALVNTSGTLVSATTECVSPEPVMEFLARNLSSLMERLEQKDLESTHICVEFGNIALLAARMRPYTLVALFKNLPEEDEQLKVIEMTQGIIESMSQDS